jgi:acetolactate synthase-1/2/3 large subunit
VVDHAAMFGPIAKGSMRLKAGDGAADIVALLERSVAHPQGPVHFDLSSRQAAAPAKGAVTRRPQASAPVDAGILAAAKRLLAGAKRPVVIVGVQAREAGDAVRRFVNTVNCAVLATYKAKGIVPEGGPHAVGLTTGGALEAPTLAQADLIIVIGFDPIELIPQPWRYKAPIIEIGRVAGLPHYKMPDASLIGPLAPALDALREQACDSQWKTDEIKALKNRMRDALRVESRQGLSPSVLVEAVARKAPRGARATVDAGAHMFSAMGFWQADEPSGVLISNGLSTMAYALPAAIGSALAEPHRPVVCFTGDGGLLMCLSELATAVEQRSKITIVVFNDGALSLIDIKQQKRQMPTRGVRYGAIDFATIALGFGCRSFRAADAAELDRALAETFAGEGPVLIDVQVDPGAYPRQIEAMRG